MKIESFYCEREEEATAWSAIIKEQLEELKDHRKVFHVCTLYNTFGALND